MRFTIVILITLLAGCDVAQLEQFQQQTETGQDANTNDNDNTAAVSSVITGNPFLLNQFMLGTNTYISGLQIVGNSLIWAEYDEELQQSNYYVVKYENNNFVSGVYQLTGFRHVGLPSDVNTPVFYEGCYRDCSGRPGADELMALYANCDIFPHGGNILDVSAYTACIQEIDVWYLAFTPVDCIHFTNELNETVIAKKTGVAYTAPINVNTSPLVQFSPGFIKQLDDGGYLILASRRSDENANYYEAKVLSVNTNEYGGTFSKPANEWVQAMAVVDGEVKVVTSAQKLIPNALGEETLYLISSEKNSNNWTEVALKTFDNRFSLKDVYIHDEYLYVAYRDYSGNTSISIDFCNLKACALSKLITFSERVWTDAKVIATANAVYAIGVVTSNSYDESLSWGSSAAVQIHNITGGNAELVYDYKVKTDAVLSNAKLIGNELLFTFSGRLGGDYKATQHYFDKIVVE